MSRAFNGTTQFLRRSTAVLSGGPFTVSVWFYTTNDNKNNGLFYMGNGSNNTDYFLLEAHDNSSFSRKCEFEVRTSGAITTALTSTSYSVNTWHHICGVEESSTSHLCFLDGGGKATDNTDVTPTGLNRTSIGVFDRSTQGDFTDGRIAEVAIWDIALSDNEVLLLANRLSPLLMRPESLVFYTPLMGRTSPEIDIVGSLNMPLNNSPTAAAHIPIIYPTGLTTQLNTVPPPTFPRRFIMTVSG